MPGNKYNGRNPTRDAGNSDGSAGYDDAESCGREPGVSDREAKGARETNCEHGAIPIGEVVDAGLAAGKTSGNGCKRSDGKVMRQRLLVVANKLPVSAVRHGEDLWLLEISAGGLVSALLEVMGNWILCVPPHPQFSSVEYASGQSKISCSQIFNKEPSCWI